MEILRSSSERTVEIRVRLEFRYFSEGEVWGVRIEGRLVKGEEEGIGWGG